jgi:formylglycine-generating enzyme
MIFLLFPLSQFGFAETKGKTTLPASVKKELYTAVPIPKGEFRMGCSMEQGYYCGHDEKPVHVVQITQPFYMMKSEVSQELYQSITKENPSRFSKCGSKCPIENISWREAVIFANTLSTKEGLETCYDIQEQNVLWSKGVSCKGWRLPTEAEWEYAARGGKIQTYAGSKEIEPVGWYVKNAKGKTHLICEKQENAFDLCDMNGNVEEWVWDWYEPKYFVSQSKKEKVVNPLGSESSKYKVLRGGHFRDEEVNVHTSARNAAQPNKTYETVGFRLCRSIF